ncbi:MAG: right-handed parallel beta-helix repeat-containing protein [Kofleriaceae bacterium]
MAVYDIHTGDDLYARLSMLQAGDTVTVHAGTYTTPGFLEVTWPGTAGAPIVIQAATGEHVILQGQSNQNVINIKGDYWTLDGFEITGGSHGLRLEQVSNATISNNTIHGLGDVGISCNFEMNCDALVIRHNEIYDTGHDGTGEGMYLGCNDGSCTLTNSLVVNNYVHDIGGSQGDGIEIKMNSWGNTVVDNVIVRPNYPGITMYGFTGTHPFNIVERNLVWHAKTDNGIQVAGQIVVRNNLVLDAATNGIQSKATAGITTSDVTIEYNTIVGAATCIKTNDWAAGDHQIIANNANAQCATEIDVNGGAGADLVEYMNGLTQLSAFEADNDFYPRMGSPLVGTANPAVTVADDFNGFARFDGMPDTGAYERGITGSNPGWMIQEGFKNSASASSDTVRLYDDIPLPTDSNNSSGGCCDAGGAKSNGILALAVAALLTSSGRRSSSRRRRPA